MKLNIGCGPYPAKGWVNLDCHLPETGPKPDVVADLLAGLPYKDRSVHRVYLGHVLEHISWSSVPAVLAEVRRVMAAGAKLLAVGPDCGRALKLWKAGVVDWQTALNCLEAASPDDDDRPGGRHQWNCTELRLTGALRRAGFEATPVAVSENDLSGWPVVSFAPWQCAVRGEVA